MDFHFLQTPSLPLLMHDALVVAGAGVALLAGLVFINLGVLLPGLLSSLGGRQGDPNVKHVEFGPAAAPLISEPAPRRASSLESHPGPRPLKRTHLWHHVSGGGMVHLISPFDAGMR